MVYRRLKKDNLRLLPIEHGESDLHLRDLGYQDAVAEVQYTPVAACEAFGGGAIERPRQTLPGIPILSPIDPDAGFRQRVIHCARIGGHAVHRPSFAA